VNIFEALKIPNKHAPIIIKSNNKGTNKQEHLHSGFLQQQQQQQLQQQ
jgi:hypothetical protein